LSEISVELETRVAKLESDVSHLRADVSEIKTDLRTGFARIDTRIDRLESKFDTRFVHLDTKFDTKIDKLTNLLWRAQVWALLLYIALAASMLGTMAHGFGWI
jgi:hypothetical protein